MSRKLVQSKAKTHSLEGEVVHQLSDLKAVVLLAGSVRASNFRRAISRSFVNLPVTPQHTVIDTWQLQMDAVARQYKIDTLPIRVMLDRSTSTWQVPPFEHSSVTISLEQDPFEFRGTGGLLSDLAAQYEDHEFLLVANAAQILIGSMTDIIRDLAAIDADVAMVSLQDGTPTEIMLIRCGALRSVAKVGYVDLKEQALPHIAKNHDVRVVIRDQIAGFPIRTLSGYLDGLREYYRKQKGITQDHVLYDEEWRATFELIEKGAAVHESAIIHDSVILSGAQVGSNAVVVRSVVAPTGIIQEGQSAIDMIVGRA